MCSSITKCVWTKVYDPEWPCSFINQGCLLLFGTIMALWRYTLETGTGASVHMQFRRCTDCCYSQEMACLEPIIATEKIPLSSTHQAIFKGINSISLHRHMILWEPQIMNRSNNPIHFTWLLFEAYWILGGSIRCLWRQAPPKAPVSKTPARNSGGHGYGLKSGTLPKNWSFQAT